MYVSNSWCVFPPGEEIARPRRSTPTASPAPDTPRCVCVCVVYRNKIPPQFVGTVDVLF